MSRSPAATVRMILIAVCAFSLLSACGPGKSSDSPPEAGDIAAAKVGEQTIWASDVKREAVAQGLIGEGEPLDVSSDLFRRMLDQVVDQKLLASEALKRKLDKDPIAQRRLDAARERILGDMLVEKVVEGAVTENAIRALYQDQLKQAKQSEEFRARQILVATQAEADAIKKLIQAGGSFDALAMERSTDAATRFNGGDLGYFTSDVMPDAYGQALKTAKKGELVGPFKTEGGFAVLKVEDRRPEEPITLETARPQIVRFLTYDEVRLLLERLRRRASVKTLIGAPIDVPGAPTEPASAPADTVRPPNAEDMAKPGSGPATNKTGTSK